jgi:hypothetical protein
MTRLRRTPLSKGWIVMTDFLFSLPLWLLAIILNVWLFGLRSSGFGS